MPKTSEAQIKVPRPPNAWIIYRSDKLRSLPPRNAGEGRTQADVSKMISNMWRQETAQVKAEYERLADTRKAEHHMMYPNYKFQPVKKEEKLRIKAEKKIEKERKKKGKQRRSSPYAASSRIVAPATVPAIAHPLPYGFPMYIPEVRFGPQGPSPPISAAPSPTDSGSPQAGPSDSSTLSYPASAQASTYATPSPSGLYHQLPMYPPPLDPAYGAFFASLAEAPQHQGPAIQLPVPLTPMSMVSHHYAMPQPSSTATNTTNALTPEWSEFDSSQSQIQPQVQPEAQSSQTAQNMLMFPFSSLGTQNNQRDWSCEPTTEGLEESDSMQALLAATLNPSVFQLNEFDPACLLANPGSDLEIAMGPKPQEPFPEFDPDMFGNFDFTSPFDSPSFDPSSFNMSSLPHGTRNATVDPQATMFNSVDIPSQEDIASLFATNAPEVPKQRQVSLFTQQIMQYVNLDATAEGAGTTGVQHESTSRKPSNSHHPQLTPILEQVSTNTMVQSSVSGPPQVGVPSNRRVASNWKQYVIPEEPASDPWDLSNQIDDDRNLLGHISPKSYELL